MDFAVVLTHHWLKRIGDLSFHAFESPKLGSRSLCGEWVLLDSIRDLQIPGDRSVCCVSCHVRLYGFPLPVSKEKNELGYHS